MVCAEPGTARLWRFDQPMEQSATQGVVTYHTTNWSADLGHVSHANARAGVNPAQQFACSSNATRLDMPRSNEIVCFRLDGSLDVLVVAPVMTNLDAAGVLQSRGVEDGQLRAWLVVGRIGIGDQRAELFARGAGRAEHPAYRTRWRLGGGMMPIKRRNNATGSSTR